MPLQGLVFDLTSGFSAPVLLKESMHSLMAAVGFSCLVFNLTLGGLRPQYLQKKSFIMWWQWWDSFGRRFYQPILMKCEKWSSTWPLGVQGQSISPTISGGASVLAFMAVSSISHHLVDICQKKAMKGEAQKRDRQKK